MQRRQQIPTAFHDLSTDPARYHLVAGILPYNTWKAGAVRFVLGTKAHYTPFFFPFFSSLPYLFFGLQFITGAA